MRWCHRDVVSKCCLDKNAGDCGSLSSLPSK